MIKADVTGEAVRGFVSMNEKVEKVALALGTYRQTRSRGTIHAKGGVCENTRRCVFQGSKEKPCPLFFALTYLFRKRQGMLKDLLL